MTTQKPAPLDFDGAWRVIVSWRNRALPEGVGDYASPKKYVYDSVFAAERRVRKSQRECGKYPSFNCRIVMESLEGKHWVKTFECFLTPQDSHAYQRRLRLERL